MSDDRIKIVTSSPSLTNKVKINIEGYTDIVYWYMKFNIPLDAATVSRDTMSVTDTEGYIMRTEIRYNKMNNLIIISPLDTYQQNIYYILSVSKKVKSAKGQNLKREIHILFKLIDNRISEFEILKSTVRVPQPKERPANYDKRFQAPRTKSKVYSFENELVNNIPQDRLPVADLKINLLVGVGGLLLMVGSIFLKVPSMVKLGGLAICLIGVGHIIFQLTRKKTLSVLAYNKGVRLFNKERYKEADIRFKKALIHNPDNELAEYGANKVSFYI